jgi:hypothetical protein
MSKNIPLLIPNPFPVNSRWKLIKTGYAGMITIPTGTALRVTGHGLTEIQVKFESVPLPLLLTITITPDLMLTSLRCTDQVTHTMQRTRRFSGKRYKRCFLRLSS